MLKTSPAELPGRIAALSDERRRLERELAEAKKALALAGPPKSGGDSAREIAGVKTVLRLVEDVAPKDLKALADDAKSKIGSGVVAFVTVAEGKASLVVGVTPDLTSRISAVDLVRGDRQSRLCPAFTRAHRGVERASCAGGDDVMRVPVDGERPAERLGVSGLRRRGAVAAAS